jgi:segregation and condensation protein B
MSANEAQPGEVRNLQSILEAVLFAAPEPLRTSDVVEVLASVQDGLFLSEDDVTDAIFALNNRYEGQNTAFRITETGDGWSFTTLAVYQPWLRAFQHQNEKRRLSQAGLETLAIVAYRQPVSKPEVDRIRGVDSGYSIKQLLEKELISVAGRSEAPGRPLLYETTRLFLKHFGLKSVADLPKPREIDEILNDEDMREHRQMMLELRKEITDYENPETQD